MFLGPEDNVAEYYQQQVEMLEGFNEMDALAERGFIPGMSKVCFTVFMHYVLCRIKLEYFADYKEVETGKGLRFGC